MGVDKLADKDKQPFYNVLVADGSQRYAAQENLVSQRICLAAYRIWDMVCAFVCAKLCANCVPTLKYALKYALEYFITKNVH